MGKDGKFPQIIRVGLMRSNTTKRWLLSFGQYPQKITRRHVVFENFASIDKDYRHFVVVLLLQFRTGVNVHLAPPIVGLVLEYAQRLLDHIAEMTSLARIHRNVVHVAIVNRNEWRDRPFPLTCAALASALEIAADPCCLDSTK